MSTEPCPTNYTNIDPKDCCPRDAVWRALLAGVIIDPAAVKSLQAAADAACLACQNRIKVVYANAMSHNT